MERIDGREYFKALKLSQEKGISVAEALKQPPAPPAPVAALSVLAPTTVDDTLHLLAGTLPPADESEVEREVLELLRTRYSAITPHELTDGQDIKPGQLVYHQNAHKRRPVGVTPGQPDVSLARAGHWGWVHIELKRRGSKGRMQGALSREQRASVLAGLTALAWAPAHVALIIDQLDAAADKGPTT